MKIFHLVGWSEPGDWAARPAKHTLGFFRSKEGAENEIKKIKKAKDWRMQWSDFQIWEADLKD